MECISVSSRSRIKVFWGGDLGSNGRGGPESRGYLVKRRDAEGDVGDFIDLAFCCFSELNNLILIDLRGAISSAGGVRREELDDEEGFSSSVLGSSESEEWDASW